MGTWALQAVQSFALWKTDSPRRKIIFYSGIGAGVMLFVLSGWPLWHRRDGALGGFVSGLLIGAALIRMQG